MAPLAVSRASCFSMMALPAAASWSLRNMSRSTPTRTPRRLLAGSAVRSATGCSRLSDVARSSASKPRITLRTTAASAVVLACTPTRSCVNEIGSTPARLTSPRDGTTPISALFDAGLRTETPVSVPRPTVAKLAAIATPVPPLDPPGFFARLYGFRICPPTVLKPRTDCAISSMLALAMMMAPAWRSFSITVASSAGRLPANTSLPPVVGMSAVSMLSFTTIGMPWSGPRRPLALRSASISRAISTARGLMVMIAFSRGPFLS